VAAGLAAVAEVVWARGAGRRGTGRPVEPQRVASARPATAAGGQLPRPGWAPLGIALGLGGVALGGAFGPAIAVAGILVTLSSARAWLAAEVRETDDAHRAERPSSDQDAAAGRSPADRGGPDVASEGS